MSRQSQLFAYTAVLFSLVTSLVLGGTSAAYAASSDSPLPFVVQPIYPPNQQPSVRGYFELKATPGGHQKLQVHIINKNSHAISISISPANALTTTNGGIQYVESNGSQSTHLLNSEFDLGDHITVPNVVTIASNSQTTVPINVVFPTSRVGTYLGGIIFSNYVPGQPIRPSNTKEKVTFTVNSRFSMAMALQLDMPTPGTPIFSFGPVTFSTVPSGSQLLIQMSNEGAALLRNVKGSFQVSNHEGRVAIKGQFGPFAMAPQSQIQYPVLWKNQLSPGTYKVQLIADYQGHHITHVGTFFIGLKQMVQYQTVTGQSPLPFQIPHWLWVGVGIVLVSMVVLGYWLGLRSKRKLIAELERKRQEGED